MQYSLDEMKYMDLCCLVEVSEKYLTTPCLSHHRFLFIFVDQFSPWARYLVPGYNRSSRTCDICRIKKNVKSIIN